MTSDSAQAPGGSSPGAGVLLWVESLSKRFGGTQALRDVDLTIHAGEVHALLGENGAGKSTLIKVLAGIHAPDGGRVIGPQGAAPSAGPLPGIAFVHQDLGLVDTLTVAEAMALSAGFAQRGPLIAWGRTRARARDALAAMDLDIDPDTLVGHLGSAEKSMVAIARALVVDARLLVLDEPTATLPEADVRRLHKAIDRLRARGLGILYVTHRLDEVFRIAQTATVLRDGAVVHAGAVGGTTPDALVEAIIGRRLEAMFPARRPPTDRPLMRVEALASKHAGPVDFTLHAGEVLGLVGLRNSGQDTIGRMVAGALPARSGRVSLQDVDLPLGDLGWAVAKGVGFVSSKRVEESVCPQLSLQENLHVNPTLGALTFINGPAERDKAQTTLTEFGVRPPEPERVIATLSGGNQQKVVLARWLSVGRTVLILEEPTTGVDIGARADIYALLGRATESGMGVLVVSSDFEEVSGLCDRALVLDRGRPVRMLTGDEITVEALTHLSGGGALAEQTEGQVA